ncbi:hypothetical protein [Halorubrum ezzemoulense]|uniref:Uncharacterized protein n=1 Tax=Halorubrum ezzemoulense TaxID=337243 RepID=A0A256JV52_HALEZ|nr:hypothetical protein [Halorubrum ezzemoulense]OYR72718.1 hypothetical protein DJ78_02025 [Halorubrum ezzemoulense]
MVRVHYSGGGRYRTSGHQFEEGDIVDVDEGLAEYLCEKDAFARVDDDTLEEAEVASEDVVDTLDEAEGFDVDAWIDDNHYQERAEEVRAGEHDDHLDAIAEAESATTVQDAVGERRAELEA